MARTFKRKQSLAAISELNVTPLIDLAFSLLIIFMITTPLLEQTIALDLPLESAKPQSDRKDDFEYVSVEKDGKVYWGKEPVTMARLDELLATVAARPDQPVISIRADKTLPYQSVIEVIDLVKSNNLTRISLDTQVK